jgi:integrase
MSLSLSELFESSYVLKPRVASGSKATVVDYRIQLRHLDRYFQSIAGREMLITDFSDQVIFGAMKSRLDSGCTVDTANKLRAFAVALWNHACDRFPDVAPRPPRRIDKFRPPKRDPECWSQEEFELILRAANKLCGTVGDVALSEFADCLLRVEYNSGARISAVMSIETAWVDVSSAQLVIRAEAQKDDEDQTVRLLPGTMDAIARLHVRGRLPRLFDDWPYDRSVVQWPALNNLLAGLIVDAGLRPNRAAVTRRDLWHKIRRTFATYITIKAGIETAREMLGHSSVEVTRRYVDKSKLGRRSQADLLTDPPRLGIYKTG